MEGNVNFDVNKGFEQLDERLTSFFSTSGRSVEVAFEIGNLHNSATLTYAEVEWHSTNVQTGDGVPSSLPPNKANDCSYFQQTKYTDALQKLLVFKTGNPGFNFMVGCFLNPSEPNYQWFTLFMDPKSKIHLPSLGINDLREALGTRPGDTWPKAGEIIPGWDITRGGWKIASSGDSLKFTDGYFGVIADMQTDGSKFIIRVFAFGNWDPPTPANWNAGIP